MTAQVAVVVAVVGFIGALGVLGAVGAAGVLQVRRARQQQRLLLIDARRERLRPSLEGLLRAAIRFERFVSPWSPRWRPQLTAEERERARGLADQLDDNAELAEVTLRLEGAARPLELLLDLRACLARFRRAIAAAHPPGAASGAGLDEAGALAATICASLPDLEHALLGQLQGQTAAGAGGLVVLRQARPGRLAWLSTLEPLQQRVFRWLWVASLASQLGTWIHNVGAVGLMTTLAPLALLLALIQTATSAPALLLGLPSGALADIVDRRRLLLASSAWMCGVSAALAVATFTHVASPWLLLALTFAIGLGAVAGLPAWQAIIPELVPPEGLAPAVTLSAVAINVSRTVAPALGGIALSLAGPGAAFALSTTAFGFTALVVLRWRRDRHADALPVEGMVAAVRFGIRYSVLNAPVRTTLIRAAGFILFASALWALMPVVARDFGSGYALYSGLLGSLGVGAVISGVVLTRIRRVLRPDALTLTGCAVFAAVLLGAAVVPSYAIAVLLTFVGGMAWTASMSTFNVCAQQAAPEWVRGRVLASYQVTHMGSLALGSAVWGVVASRLGLAPALDAAALLLLLNFVLTLRWRLDSVPRAEPRPAEAAPVPDPGGAAVQGAPPPLPWSPELVHSDARPVPVRREPEAVAVPAGRDLTGRRLGPYELEAVIASGPAGSVYRARHPALDVPCAVRIVEADAGAEPGTDESAFLRAARSAARLHHPNIVPVFDCGVEDGLRYVVTEHVDALTLEERLDLEPGPRRPADPAVERWIRDLASALDYAHSRGVVHRHLQPVSVLIRTVDDRAMLTDFGIGAAPADPGGTTPGGVSHPRPYLSPEQWDGSAEPTSAADVYALAAMLHEIATGAPPAGRVLAAIAGHASRPLPPLQLTAPNLPGGLLAVLDRGLASAPADRHRTAGELAAAYLDLVDERPVPILPAAAPAPAQRTAPARGLALPGLSLAGVAATLALMLIAGSLGLVQGVQRPHQSGTAGIPAPVKGAIGAPLLVGGLELTVLRVNLDAAPPPEAQLGSGRELVLVAVQYRSEGTSPAIVSPFDWVMTDSAGAIYGAVTEGVAGALAQRALAPGATAKGVIGFVVPAQAAGLVLDFDAERGDGSAQVPVS